MSVMPPSLAKSVNTNCNMKTPENTDVLFELTCFNLSDRCWLPFHVVFISLVMHVHAGLLTLV